MVYLTSHSKFPKPRNPPRPQNPQTSVPLHLVGDDHVVVRLVLNQHLVGDHHSGGVSTWSVMITLWCVSYLPLIPRRMLTVSSTVGSLTYTCGQSQTVVKFGNPPTPQEERSVLADPRGDSNSGTPRQRLPLA